jgi:hypothetical protein
MLQLNKGNNKKIVDIGSDVIFRIAAAKIGVRLPPLMGAVEAAASEAIEDFFRQLAARLGKDASLADQIGSGPEWGDLSPAYVERKKSKAFFVYTGLTKTAVNGWRKPKAGLTVGKTWRDNKQDRAAARVSPLIRDLYRADAVRAFGRPQIEQGKATFGKAGVDFEEQLYALMKSARALDFAVRLWPAVPAGRVRHIETHLASRRIISDKSADKLIGKKKWHRPAVLPFMDHYARVVIPAVVLSVLKAKGGVKATGGLRTPSGNPLTFKQQLGIIPNSRFL